MPGLGLAPYLLLLFALSAHSVRQILRCDDIPLGVKTITAPLSLQICAAGSNAQYMQNVFISVNDARNVSVYEISHGDVSEDTGLSCYSLPQSIVSIDNRNANKDCSEDFIIFMDDTRVAAVAVTHEQRVTPINITDGRPLLLLSATGRIKLEFLQGKENVASIRAGSNSGSRTIYNVNYEYSTPTPSEYPSTSVGPITSEGLTGTGITTISEPFTMPLENGAYPRTPELEVPDTYVLFDSIVQIVPRNAEHFTISRSTDILDEHILSPGSFVVVGTFAYPDARHLNGQDNRAVFKVNESVQIDSVTNYFFDKQFGGGIRIVAGGLWFNGSRVYSSPHNLSDELSYYGDSFEISYLTIVHSGSQSFPNNDYFATEVRVRELPPYVTEPPVPSKATPPTFASSLSTGQPTEATVTSRPTRAESTAFTRPAPTGFPSEDGKYCACRYDHLWLDVVFLVEATDSMSKEGIDDVIAFIQGALYQMSKGDRRFSTRAGIIAYGADARVIARFSDLLTDDNVDDISIPFLGGKETNIESAIRQANDMLSQASGSRRARKVIVLVATAFRAGSYDDPHQIAEGFRESGGTIITIDYIEKDGIVDPKLTSLATPTFAYNNTNGVYTFGDDDLLKAFCDINCFCSTNERGFEMPELVSRPGLPTGGCYEIVTLAAVERAARIDCRRKNASLPSIHTEHKQRYLTSLFPPKTQHWIGLEREGASYAWIDYTPYDYSNWPKDADIGTGPAFYSWQYSGFRTGWFSAPTTKSAQYTCQFAPCDSLNDACLVEEP